MKKQMRRQSPAATALGRFYRHDHVDIGQIRQSPAYRRLI